MENKTSIPTWRKVLYYGGMGLTILGVILFISVFFSFFSIFNSPQLINPGSTFVRPLIGMILMIVGQFVQSIGAKGLRGSGVVLDPDGATEDLKPYSKAVGKMVNDGLEEVTAIKKESIKIKCRDCGTLNDENAKFCDNCGTQL